MLYGLFHCFAMSAQQTSIYVSVDDCSCHNNDILKTTGYFHETFSRKYLFYTNNARNHTNHTTCLPIARLAKF